MLTTCIKYLHSNMYSTVHLFSRVQIFAIPWIAACQASLPNSHTHT